MAAILAGLALVAWQVGAWYAERPLASVGASCPTCGLEIDPRYPGSLEIARSQVRAMMAERRIPGMAALVAHGVHDVVLGSRILGTGALRGGMPLYKFISNRFLTLVQNLLVGHKLSEYHTGFRAFSRRVLTTLPLLEDSDDFIFDNEMLTQAIRFGFRIGEITCPTRYMADSSSINFSRSVLYGLGVLRTSLRCRLSRWGVGAYPFLSPGGRKLESGDR